MKSLLNWILRIRSLLILVLVTTIISLTGCSPWIAVGEHSATYDEYSMDPTNNCEQTYRDTVTEESRYGYYSSINFIQNLKFVFTFSGFIIVATPTFTGTLSLPFVGPDCDWGDDPSECQNTLPFTGSYRANSITVNINHTRGNEHFEGQLYFRAIPETAAEPLIGTWITYIELDTSKQNWITKSVGGNCVGKIVFSRYEAWGGDTASIQQQLEGQGTVIPLGVDLQ